MHENIQVPSELLDNTVTFVELASLTAKRALDEVGVHRQGQTKAAALRPALLALMIEKGVVAPHQKEAADAMLASHDTTMQLLHAATEKIAELRTGKTVGEPGKADPDDANGTVKQAGDYKSTEDPFVGRRTDRVKESDMALLRGAGMA